MIRRTLAALGLGALSLGLGVAAGLALLWYLAVQPVLSIVVKLSGALP